MDQHKLLTPLELKVMNVLWSLGKAFVRELVEQWPEEKEPKFNTVSTIVRILEKKGFVGHEPVGRGHCYYPLISKRKYQQHLLGNVLETVFSDSMTGLVSTLLDQRKASQTEIDELKDLLSKQD
ncbi:MAG: BlaI/MecI/CopY family transcriptional regulator [Bacteroidia bacterium]|nr:BlaI/MecI/CopY family transcriptional regulator [Bacteroidia bacterium]